MEGGAQRRRLYGGVFGGARATGRARINRPLYRQARYRYAVNARRLALRAGYRRRRAAAAILNQRTAGFLGVEKKFFDSGVSTAVAIASSATMAGCEVDPTAIPAATLCLSAPGVADTEQGRDGRKIVIKSIQVTGDIRVPAAELLGAPPSGCKVLLALVLDTQTNAAQLNSEDVFVNPSTSTLTAATPLRNMLNGNRFKVLKSQVFDMDVTNVSHFAVDSFSHGGNCQTFNWFLPLNITVMFNGGTTAVVGNVIDNSLHLIASTDNVTPAPTITYNSRMRFIG